MLAKETILTGIVKKAMTVAAQTMFAITNQTM